MALGSTIPKPIDLMGVLDWDTVHSMIISWILRSMDAKVAGTIPMHENVRDLWVYIERRFCVANGPRIQQIKIAISDCKQVGSMSVDEYYSKLMGYYDELARLKPLPSCECHKCDCGLVSKLARDREDEIFDQFLIGLDTTTYGAVRTNLLSQQPLGDINRAYQTLKKGHEVTTCFKLHGNPEWYEERLRARNSGRLDGSPNNGPAAGGGSVGAASGSGGGSTAGAARGPGGVRAHIVDDGAFSSNTERGTSLASLTQEQIQALMTLINTEHKSSDRMAGTEWIIDTRASHHITGNLSVLVNVRSITVFPVSLPNGCSASATMRGDVYLTDDLVLHHVLFVPDFQCHLIYVSHLLADNDCIIQFTSTLCAIEDRSSRTLIGAGRPSERVVKLLPAFRSSHDRKKLNNVVSSVPSSCGVVYFLTLVDDYSRAVWVYLLHNKTQVYKYFLSFFAMVKRQFATNVQIVRSDNGTEFQCMLPFFDQSGILFQTSCTGTPQQNGRVERKHQHKLNVSRALMF
ncbi:uncharacterized protein LOC104883080 [Beta vulgaris subsp. vulgaris]|uniref:uncharacterized protein LOC104883080 n=1 Tax=Beta vulgaris subsp. vulgaris TaxID=3555 RepID=UPI00053F491E|nr:uncharacterized protein LOC104883080 [Beta vulgaris subsp. vulgaris]